MLESHRRLYKDLENLWIGYYWEVVEDEFGCHFEHHGRIYGNQNWIIIYAKYRFGISIITNASFPEVNPLLKQTATSIFKDFCVITE